MTSGGAKIKLDSMLADEIRIRMRDCNTHSVPLCMLFLHIMHFVSSSLVLLFVRLFATLFSRQ